MNDLKKEIIRAFKLSGFQIRSELAQFLSDELIDLSREEQKIFLDTIVIHIQNQGLSIPNIERNNLEAALKECSNTGLNDTETVFNVINAFEIPKYTYDSQRKKFILNEKSKKFLPPAKNKADYIRERYMMLYQRTSRHELFAAPVQTTKKIEQRFQLKQVENLLATTSMSDVVILGYLTSFVEGKFHIEDPTGSVQLDLTNVKFHSGLFCEGCFVLAEGRYRDGILKVSGLGFPPPETAKSSRAYFGVANYWGGNSKTLLKMSNRLAEIERQDTDATIIFVSDCWLNDPIVLDKLKCLFTGYDECPPTAIVMMGPFTKNVTEMYSLKSYFSQLGDLLAACLTLKKETDIILVPALDDPAAPSILPRSPLPDHLIADFKKKVPRCISATNPCRLQYCTQQIVVARIDLITKLCRNVIKFPETGELSNHFARTLICQGTLAPVHPITLPIYWDYDSALSLYPLPDLVVIGDPSHGFQVTQQECTIMNVGSFPKSKFSFKVYIPATRIIEDSQIPDDTD